MNHCYTSRKNRRKWIRCHIALLPVGFRRKPAQRLCPKRFSPTYLASQSGVFIPFQVAFPHHRIFHPNRAIELIRHHILQFVFGDFFAKLPSDFTTFPFSTVTFNAPQWAAVVMVFFGLSKKTNFPFSNAVFI